MKYIILSFLLTVSLAALSQNIDLRQSDRVLDPKGTFIKGKDTLYTYVNIKYSLAEAKWMEAIAEMQAYGERRKNKSSFNESPDKYIHAIQDAQEGLIQNPKVKFYKLHGKWITEKEAIKFKIPEH